MLKGILPYMVMIGHSSTERYKAQKGANKMSYKTKDYGATRDDGSGVGNKKTVVIVTCCRERR